MMARNWKLMNGEILGQKILFFGFFKKIFGSLKKSYYICKRNGQRLFFKLVFLQSPLILSSSLNQEKNKTKCERFTGLEYP